MLKIITVLTFFAVLTVSCQNSATVPPAKSEAISMSRLARDYKESKDAVRGKYDGKEISVRGYSLIAPIMPKDDKDEGLLLLTEKDGDPFLKVNCFFKKSDEVEFKRITGGQFFTVKGTFDGKDEAALKSCKLVEVE